MLCQIIYQSTNKAIKTLALKYLFLKFKILNKSGEKCSMKFFFEENIVKMLFLLVTLKFSIC